MTNHKTSIHCQFYNEVLRLCDDDQSTTDDAPSKTEILRHFVAQGANVNTRSLEFRNFSALQYAVWKKNVAVAKVLLEMGCNVNLSGSSRKEMPLHLACQSGEMSMVVLLVDAGAALDLVDEDGLTAASVAATSGCHHILQFLLENGASPAVGQSLFSFGACRHPRVVETLIANNVNVNARSSKTCYTALHRVARTADNTECIRLLLDAGANIDAIDNRNESAIFNAIALNSPANLTALLLAGARTDLFSKTGDGVVRYAFSIWARDCLRILLAWQTDDIDDEGSAKGSYNYYCNYYVWLHTTPQPAVFGDTPGTVHQDIARERKRLEKLLFAKITLPTLNLAIALQSIGLPALVTLYIVNTLYDTGQRVPMHKKWNVITAIKHF